MVFVEGHQVKCLSQTEIEEQHRLGLCLNCNEKFGRGHNRVCQRIFLLDLTEDDEAEDVQEVDTAVSGEAVVDGC